ncbi:methyltransferase [Krasilnikovia sp. MM14-A1259]|uniref:methyltransferase n=1 Tax=Krasilnikovia sp. MM14-A1259 TaxID=3373539 RepID=UPI0038170EEE
MSLNQAPLLDLVNGIKRSKTLAAAVDLDLFTWLAGGRSATVTEFAAEYGLSQRPADLLLTALVSIGLLDKDGDRYANSALSERFLVAGKPDYFGGYVQLYDRKIYPGWLDVSRALRNNRPTAWDPAVQDSLFSEHDALVMETFWEGMHAIAGMTARALADVYDFAPFRRLLDVGGGSGGFPIALCERYPGLSATVHDLPHVCPIAAEKVEAAGLENRIRTVAGDFAKDAALPAGHDVILLSQILHDHGEASNRALLKKCWDALPPGGAVVIVEFVLDTDRTGPPEAALMGMTMLVVTPEGKNCSDAEYASWLAEAGFVDLKAVRFEAAGANGAVIARKPAV